MQNEWRKKLSKKYVEKRRAVAHQVSYLFFKKRTYEIKTEENSEKYSPPKFWVQPYLIYLCANMAYLCATYCSEVVLVFLMIYWGQMVCVLIYTVGYQFITYVFLLFYVTAHNCS